MAFPAVSKVWPPILWLAVTIAPGTFQDAPEQFIVATNASTSSPIGQWKTVDDKTGKVKSIVTIRETDQELDGTIEKLFDPPVPHPTCYLCSGAMKDRPLVGLQVLWGFRQDGDEWSGGRVLDPESGRIYHASLTVEDGGKKLRLRGYIGVPLLGRTEYWVRVD